MRMHFCFVSFLQMKNEWEAVYGQLLVYLKVSDEFFNLIFLIKN